MEALKHFDNGEYGYRTYGGSDAKMSVYMDGDHYMVKFPQKLTNQNDLQSSYANNVISEYIGSHIMASLGLPTHETYLGFFKNELVVGCKDFCAPGERHVEFASFMREVYRPNEIGRFPSYIQLYKTFEKNERLRPLQDAAIKRYWQECIGDALIGNFDRHKGNFGFLVNEKEQTIRLSPIYDCGSSLYPNLAEREMLQILDDPEAIKARVYMYPAIALNKFDGAGKEKKFGYYELLSGQHFDKNCLLALRNIGARIDLPKIHDIIDQTPLISDTRKHFYKTMIDHRKTMIIDKALERCAELGISEQKPDLRDVWQGMDAWKEAQETRQTSKEIEDQLMSATDLTMKEKAAKRTVQQYLDTTKANRDDLADILARSFPNQRWEGSPGEGADPGAGR